MGNKAMLLLLTGLEKKWSRKNIVFVIKHKKTILKGNGMKRKKRIESVGFLVNINKFLQVL
jgi:hypothetical protein